MTTLNHFTAERLADVCVKAGEAVTTDSWVTGAMFTSHAAYEAGAVITGVDDAKARNEAGEKVRMCAWGQLAYQAYLMDPDRYHGTHQTVWEHALSADLNVAFQAVVGDSDHPRLKDEGEPYLGSIVSFNDTLGGYPKSRLDRVSLVKDLLARMGQWYRDEAILQRRGLS